MVSLVTAAARSRVARNTTPPSSRSCVGASCLARMSHPLRACEIVGRVRYRTLAETHEQVHYGEQPRHQRGVVLTDRSCSALLSPEGPHSAALHIAQDVCSLAHESAETFHEVGGPDATGRDQVAGHPLSEHPAPESSRSRDISSMPCGRSAGYLGASPLASRTSISSLASSSRWHMANARMPCCKRPATRITRSMNCGAVSGRS